METGYDEKKFASQVSGGDHIQARADRKFERFSQPPQMIVNKQTISSAFGEESSLFSPMVKMSKETL